MQPPKKYLQSAIKSKKSLRGLNDQQLTELSQIMTDFLTEGLTEVVGHLNQGEPVEFNGKVFFVKKEEE